MKVLFIHQNFPGQYKHLARALAADPANQVVFVSKPKAETIPGVKKLEYKLTRDATKETHRYIIGFERAIFQGQEVWRMLKKLKAQGFVPDVVCAHPGWGDALFVKDIYPNSMLLNYVEFFYRAFGADVHFNPKESVVMDDLARIRVKNANNLINLDACDWAICPTNWQKSVHPEEYHHKISALHEGIDTDIVAPGGIETMKLPGGRILDRKKDEIVTYVARNFEPYRGFDVVMRAVDKITRERPNCHVLMVGSDGVSYGKALDNNMTYREMMLKELKMDMSRVHFLGSLPYNDYLKVLKISGVHIYLTVPFVLSWSMLESMAAGCAVVGSATQPVMEVIEDGKNGLLVPIDSPEKVVEKLHAVLDHPTRMQHIKDAARQTILDKYALKKILPIYLNLVRDLAERRLPPPTAELINRMYDPVIVEKIKYRKVNGPVDA